MTMRDWQVQEAKSELSALIRAAQDAPQAITRNGKIAAIVLSPERFDQITAVERARSGTLLDFFSEWGNLAIPERDASDSGREVVF